MRYLVKVWLLSCFLGRSFSFTQSPLPPSVENGGSEIRVPRTDDVSSRWCLEVIRDALEVSKCIWVLPHVLISEIIRNSVFSNLSYRSHKSWEHWLLHITFYEVSWCQMQSLVTPHTSTRTQPCPGSLSRTLFSHEFLANSCVLKWGECVAPPLIRRMSAPSAGRLARAPGLTNDEVWHREMLVNLISRSPRIQYF